MKRALIFGRARDVWTDMARAQALSDYELTIGVGSAAVDYPGPFDVWISFHAVFFDYWTEKRKAKGYPLPREYWSSIHRGMPVPARMPSPGSRLKVSYHRCEGGSSGLVASITAVEALGVDRAVLAGIPMDADAGQYDTNELWKEADKHREAWLINKDKIIGRVKSMSGWTRELLGAPTREWLSEIVYA